MQKQHNLGIVLPGFSEKPAGVQGTASTHKRYSTTKNHMERIKTFINILKDYFAYVPLPIALIINAICGVFFVPVQFMIYFFGIFGILFAAFGIAMLIFLNAAAFNFCKTRAKTEKSISTVRFVIYFVITLIVFSCLAFSFQADGDSGWKLMEWWMPI